MNSATSSVVIFCNLSNPRERLFQHKVLLVSSTRRDQVVLEGL